MHTSRILGAFAIATVSLLCIDARQPTAAATATVVTPPPPLQTGHLVLVVEGDRNGLAVTFARHKPSRWAGVPKGFTSDWQLRIQDAAGQELQRIPLDVRPFATGAAQVGKPATVRGCVVVDSHIGMLVNVPVRTDAAHYQFVRPDATGERDVVIGSITHRRIVELCGGGR